MDDIDLKLLKMVEEHATIREMVEHTGLRSTSSVSHRLKRLQASGLLTHEKGLARVGRKLTAAGYAVLKHPESVKVGRTSNRNSRPGSTGPAYADWEQTLVREMRQSGQSFAAIARAIQAQGGQRTRQSVQSFCARNEL